MRSNNWFGPAIKATPLHYCETIVEVETVFELGFKGDEECVGINTFIHSVEDFKILELCLKQGANPNAGLPKVAPLHCQTNFNNIKLLVEYGADINAKDQFGRSPIHCCTSIETLKYLLNLGASHSALDSDNELPEEHYSDDQQGELMKAYLTEFRIKRQIL